MIVGLFFGSVASCTIQHHGSDSGGVQAADDTFDADDDDTGGEAVPSWREPDRPLRSVRSLDGTWTFIPEGYPARDVRVPCFWENIPVYEGYENCPGYLDGTPDENLDITEGSNWDRRTIHRGTYLLDIDIPEPSPVTRLRFQALHHQASVFLNDAEIGTQIGAYRPAVFDASAAAIPGTNKLRVELVDGSALLGPDGFTLWPVGYYSLTDITGIYRSVTMESLPAIFIDDAFISPSVRSGELIVEYAITNSTDAEALVWIIGRAEDANGVGLETKPRKVFVPAHGSATIAVVEPWSNAVQWSPADPHLYTLRSLLLDAAGEPLDLREDRFGFREVWIEGGHYRLNGMRMNLIGDSLDDQASRPRYWATRYLSCETAPDTLQRIKDLNFGAIRFHQAPPEECLYDLTDEMGILVISESAVFARTDIVPPLHWNEEYLENSKIWLDAHVRNYRNHPSIVMWSAENEMFMYILGMPPRQAMSLAAPIRLADSIPLPGGGATTPRPVNWDGDSAFFHAFGMKPETVNWHYPFGRFWTVYPDNEWYDDAIANFEPYLIPDVPTGVGETMDVRRDDWTEHTPDQAKAMQGIAVRAMRMLGFSDMRPYKLNWSWHFFDPDGHEHPWAPHYHSLYTQEQKDRLTKILRESYHPIAVFDYEYTRTKTNADGSVGPAPLPPGAEAARTIVALNDSFLPGRPETVTWSVTDETTGERIAGDSFAIAVANGGNAVREIRFTTPAAAETHRLILRLSADMEGLPQGGFSTDYVFEVAPAE